MMITKKMQRRCVARGWPEIPNQAVTRDLGVFDWPDHPPCSECGRDTEPGFRWRFDPVSGLPVAFWVYAWDDQKRWYGPVFDSDLRRQIVDQVFVEKAA